MNQEGVIEEKTMRVLLGGAGGQTSRECLLGQGTGVKAVGVTGRARREEGEETSLHREVASVLL